jgi:hypothetical protein
MTRTALIGASLLLAIAATGPARADDVTDTLRSAIEAYEAGDRQFALEEIEFARQLMLEQKTDSLGGFLPPAPEGWTMTLDSDMAAGLAMMGGGVGAGADYAAPDGTTVTITLMADNPMVAGMAAMVSNAAAMGLRSERIGRQRFAMQDGQLLALIGNRILVQAEGDTDAARSLLETMDFDALAGFGG